MCVTIFKILDFATYFQSVMFWKKSVVKNLKTLKKNTVFGEYMLYPTYNNDATVFSTGKKPIKCIFLLDN